MKLRPVQIGTGCILKPMSLVLPGVTMMGYNRLMPCSLVLPHDQLAEHTDWQGSPARRMTVHHGSESSHLVLATRPSSLGAYTIVVDRSHDDVLTIYAENDGWLNRRTGMDLRRPFQPSSMLAKLFFTAFLCQPRPKRVLILGFGDGTLPILIYHYFPSVIIDMVENDQTVIELAEDYFDLDQQIKKNRLHVCILCLSLLSIDRIMLRFSPSRSTQVMCRSL